MSNQDINALLAHIEEVAPRKRELESEKVRIDNELRALDNDIKVTLSKVHALLATNTPISTVPAQRGRRKGRNAMQNRTTLQGAITEVLGNRSLWQASDATGLQTREIAEAISAANIWTPSNHNLFYSQVSQTISRMKKEGIVRQENDRRYALNA